MSPVPNRPQSPKSSASQPSSTDESLEIRSEETASAESIAPESVPKLVRPPSRPATPPPQAEPEPEPPAPAESSPPAVPEPVLLEEDELRIRPIPAPSEPTQYRAIGLVRGIYKPSEEQFTRGILLAPDGTEIEAVLLGRVMSLVKNHLALEQEHLWVVYPRTREREKTLHLQIVGVWEPENLSQTSEEAEDTAAEGTEKPVYVPSSEVEDNYFSIRGEVIYHEPDENCTVVKIQQSLKKKAKDTDETKFFKLILRGTLTGKTLGYFWDLQVHREDQELVIAGGTPIAMVLPKKKSASSKSHGRGGPRRPGPGGGKPGGQFRGKRPQGASGAPLPRREGSSGGSAAPKPIKKRDKSETGG